MDKEVNKLKNQEIAAIFFEMAEILEMKNVQWKPRAYRQAARAIESSKDIETIYKKGGEKLLEEIPGVGEGIGTKIVEYIETGKIKEYEKLLKTIPSHINVLLKIPSMGPKKVKKLNEELKISNLAQLESAAKKHKIASLHGFGKKSEEDILEGLSLMKSSRGKIVLKEAEKVAKGIINELKKLKEIRQISVAGSVRRKKVMIRDIDVIVSTVNPEKVIDAFVRLRDVKKVMAKGKTKAMIILKSGIQVDLRVFKPESWGAGLFYFTGSKNYNIEMRKTAINLGYKLNEYGVFDKKTNKLIAGKTEKEICQKLGVKYLNPEQR